jgi:hypothetical protein
VPPLDLANTLHFRFIDNNIRNSHKEFSVKKKKKIKQFKYHTPLNESNDSVLIKSDDAGDI